MRLVVYAAVAIVIGAAFISASVKPLSVPQLIATTTLAIAALIQRINGIQRWLSAPRDRRQSHVEALAQKALVEVCMDRIVSQEMLGLRVHVWEIPLWYRRLFPYWMRDRWKRTVKRRPFSWLARYTIRPSLRRVAAVGLVNRAPSGVKFKKGLGLIGVCAANNDQADFITLDVSNTTYQNALKSANESDWRAFGPKITHNLDLEDARKLARSYGQVIALVVQDNDSGEAIGCATISIKPVKKRSQRVTEEQFKRSLTDLTLALADVLA